MGSTVKPKAKLTPKNPMPSVGKPAAITALPHPAKVSQNVPKNSAPTRRVMSIFFLRFAQRLADTSGRRWHLEQARLGLHRICRLRRCLPRLRQKECLQGLADI